MDYIHKRKVGKVGWNGSVCVLDTVVGDPNKALGLDAEAELIVGWDFRGVDDRQLADLLLAGEEEGFVDV